MAQPHLVSHIYTADPSAHVFEGKIYVYPSHDRETDIKFNDNGDQYDMADYHVLSLDEIGKEATDHGASITVLQLGYVLTIMQVVLKTEDIPWVSKQLWAPDCARSPHDGNYYLYFPARDKAGIFRIGVAVSSSPSGPFKPDPEPIPGSFSIDPATFVDDDDNSYLYFGGLWGGQLQCYSKPNGGDFDDTKSGPQEPKGEGAKALFPRVGKLKQNMREFDGEVQELQILGEDGAPLPADDHDRRFFEAAWMHKHNGTYYFSYSTGDTHYLVYATGKSPLGPFTYAGRILEPVLGWTTHHSIVEFQDRLWLFYHDCEISKGVDHLRSVRCRELWYDAEGKIVTEKP